MEEPIDPQAVTLAKGGARIRHADRYDLRPRESCAGPTSPVAGANGTRRPRQAGEAPRRRPADAAGLLRWRL